MLCCSLLFVIHALSPGLRTWVDTQSAAGLGSSQQTAEATQAVHYLHLAVAQPNMLPHISAKVFFFISLPISVGTSVSMSLFLPRTPALTVYLSCSNLWDPLLSECACLSAPSCLPLRCSLCVHQSAPRLSVYLHAAATDCSL